MSETISRGVQRRMRDKHVAIDIETLGTSSDAIIVSIGAVNVLDDAHEFHQLVHLDQPGRSADGACVAWWMLSGNRDELVREPRVPLRDALLALSRWIGDDVDGVWCHGPAFDGVILEHAFRSVDVPWSYRALRCTRTASHIVAVGPSRQTHQALEDARWAAGVARAFLTIGGELD